MTTKLPSPRLQLRWEPIKSDWTEKVCHYELVIPLGEHDIRRENDDGEQVRSEFVVSLGKTHSEGSTRIPVFDGKVDPPFRDGAHAMWDSAALRLPVYAICCEFVTEMNQP